MTAAAAPVLASGPGGSAAVAAGSFGAAEAAAQVLTVGGNAVDAAVAAGFAACLAEPGLTSPGGGGFLHVREPDGTTTLLDFFVDAPGRGRGEEPRPALREVTVRFPGTEQVFAVGPASVAVPGCLDGWLDALRRWGRAGIDTVTGPAHALAHQGVVLEPGAADILALIDEVLTPDPAGRALYRPRGEVLRVGDVFVNEDFGHLLDLVVAGATGWNDPQLRARLVAAADGLVTDADVAAYRPVPREPLLSRLPGGMLATNPRPSFGGPVIAAALARLDTGPQDWPAVVSALAAATRETKNAGAASRRGTTHVSVVDADGMVAAMTTSNGSCSGVLVPGLGVQLNNMLGESDLHPLGPAAAVPGTRIASMMAPSVWAGDDGDLVALGSGGSERIRSALTEVMAAYALSGVPLADAVAAPRVHLDDAGVVQVEPGLGADVLLALGQHAPVNEWAAPDLYFGGVHAVRRDRDGGVTAVADSRRGGAVRVVRP